MILLSAAEQAFIQDHSTVDVQALLLRSHPAGTDIRKLAEQIQARQKARTKLPTWYASPALVFPPALSVEQASSERTAVYKASIVNGNLLIDLTGGMGIDTWAFAKRMKQVIYVEQQDGLATLAAHNLPLLNTSNVTIRVGEGLAMLAQLTQPPTATTADWIYLDPHRRNDRGGRVVKLDDCEPDVTQTGVLSRLLRHSRQVMVKASPLLDIDTAIRQLSSLVESVHIVAVQGEVKELLFIVGNQPVDKRDVQFNTVNLLADTQVDVRFRWEEEQTAPVQFGNPQQYIYEPNAAVLKAGAFRLAASRFGLTKLAPNSHLYTSDALVTDFPGRVFALREVSKPDSHTIRKLIPDLKANLTVRNFPQTVAELRKKLSLREGGPVYVLATTLLNGDKRLLITQKVDQSQG